MPAKSVNKTVLHVIRKAQELSPVVRQGRIDTDMQVTVTPILSLKGKRKGLPLKDGSKNIEVLSHSRAAMIVVSRMHPNSKYSKLTGNRWPVAMPDFHGRRDGGAAFWGYVKETAERMVRARHSSTGFLKHSWAAIIQKLLPLVKDGGGKGEISNQKSVLLSGNVFPAVGGSSVAVCRVENTIGLLNKNSVLGNKYNQAAVVKLGPVLQDAINIEAQGKMEYAVKQGWMEYDSQFNALGCVIS